MGSICEKCFGVKQEGEDRIIPEGSSNYGTTSSTMITHVPAGLTARPKMTLDPPIDEINRVELSQTTVDKVDKRFQEHADIFNNLLNSHQLLQEKYLLFVNKENENFFLSYSDVFNSIQSIKSEAGENISLERRHKHRMEIVIKEGVSVPQSTAMKIGTFNQLNQLCYDLITKLPVLKDVVNMTTNEEDQFKREVLVHSWREEDEKMSTLKKLMNNVTEFRKLPPNCDKMQTSAKELFDMILKASSILVS